MEQLLESLQKWLDPHVIGELLLDWSGKIIAALAISVIGRLIAHGISRWLARTMQRVGKRVLATPASGVVVNDLGANGVGRIVRAWVATADQAGTRSDLLERIRAAFAERGLKVPYPRMRFEQRLQSSE